MSRDLDARKGVPIPMRFKPEPGMTRWQLSVSGQYLGETYLTDDEIEALRGAAKGHDEEHDQ